MSSFKGINVRGRCHNGHLTETKSAHRRTTWEGPCAAEGCGLPVKARRYPGEPAKAKEVILAPKTPEQYPIVRIEGYGSTKREPITERPRDAAGHFTKSPIQRISTDPGAGGDPAGSPLDLEAITQKESSEEEGQGPELQAIKRGPGFFKRIKRRPKPERAENFSIIEGIY